MGKISLEKAKQLSDNRQKEAHKQLLRKNREKAIRIIKTQLPEGVKLKEYLEILDTENQKQSENENNSL